MVEARIVSVRDAVDLHLHAGPSLSHRPWDDVETARAAAAAGIKAMVVKDHYEETCSRAYYTNKLVPEVLTCGSITLNRYTGGISPASVEKSLVRGARVVFMPSLDAARHAEVYGSTGHYQLAGRTTGARSPHTSPRMATKEGISILDSHGELSPAAREIVGLAQEHKAVVATAHMSKREVYALATYAREVGFERLVITHVDYLLVTDQTVADTVKLADLGAVCEFSAAISFAAGSKTHDEIRDWIRAIGPARCIISSDCGSPLYPIPAEGLRVFAQNLYEAGITEEELRRMMVENPSALLTR
jgi:hypothetical protein